jgi:hypothetical protein
MHKRSLFPSVAFLALGILLSVSAGPDAVGLTVAHESGGTLSFYWNRAFDFPTGEAIWVDVPAIAILSLFVAAAFFAMWLLRGFAPGITRSLHSAPR